MLNRLLKLREEQIRLGLKELTFLLEGLVSQVEALVFLLQEVVLAVELVAEEVLLPLVWMRKNTLNLPTLLSLEHRL